MPTNIKIEKIVIFLENKEDIKNTQVLLEEDISIHSGTILKIEDKNILLANTTHLVDKNIVCLTSDDIKNSNPINTIKQVDLIPRESTKEEIDLIAKYNKTDDFYKHINHISYDVTPDFVFVFTSHAKLMHDFSGKTYVESFQEKYAIRYGDIVISYDEDEIFEDVEIDISKYFGNEK